MMRQNDSHTRRQRCKQLLYSAIMPNAQLCQCYRDGSALNSTQHLYLQPMASHSSRRPPIIRSNLTRFLERRRIHKIIRTEVHEVRLNYPHRAAPSGYLLWSHPLSCSRPFQGSNHNLSCNRHLISSESV